MRGVIFIALFYSSLFCSTEVGSFKELLENVKSSSESELVVSQKRVSEFQEDVKKQKKAVQELQKELKNEKRRTKEFLKLIDAKEKSVGKLEEKLAARVGNLGEMFGVVRESSGEFKELVKFSIISAEIKGREEFLEKLSKSKELPKIEDLSRYWYMLSRQLVESSKVKSFSGEVVGEGGETKQKRVVRAGEFALFNSKGYYSYSSELKKPIVLQRQPDGDALGYLRDFTDSQGVKTVALDPTKGAILELIVERPSIVERIEQSGVIGYIILFLGLIGISVGIYRGAYLFAVLSRVNAQLKDLGSLKENNPLGRVMLSVEGEKIDESVEIKIEESVLKELSKLEFGLGLLKLLAAIAPLLGLLGTVSGMIITFNAITVFGTSDPKLMAGGISTALITTVLGLVVAIPLLFIHNILSYRAKKIEDIIEQQAIGLMVKRENV